MLGRIRDAERSQLIELWAEILQISNVQGVIRDGDDVQLELGFQVPLKGIGVWVVVPQLFPWSLDGVQPLQFGKREVDSVPYELPFLSIIYNNKYLIIL